MATIKPLDLPGSSGALLLVLTKMPQGSGMEMEQRNTFRFLGSVEWWGGCAGEQPSLPHWCRAGFPWKSVQLPIAMPVTLVSHSPILEPSRNRS